MGWACASCAGRGDAPPRRRADDRPARRDRGRGSAAGRAPRRRRHAGLAPTDAYDAWSPPRTGRALGRAWRGLARRTRVPGLVGSRDPAGKPVNALSPENASGFAAETRRLALAELAALPPGEVLAAGTGPASPGRSGCPGCARAGPRTRGDQVAWALREAAVLGLLGLGGLPAYARRAARPGDGRRRGALGPLLPEPVDHVLLQADLTAVAPGPLESLLARRLQLVADVESRGGATVYRFTAGSVRRAFDAGWSAVELHDFVASVSRTPVPQPLSYLIDDTSRTFGAIRVGPAESFLRADDETALDRAAAPPQGGDPWPAPDRADGAGQQHPDRRPAAPPPRAGRRARGGGTRRDGPHRPPRRARARTPQAARQAGAARPARPPRSRRVRAIRAGDRAVAERPGGSPTS